MMITNKPVENCAQEIPAFIDRLKKAGASDVREIDIQSGTVTHIIYTTPDNQRGLAVHPKVKIKGMPTFAEVGVIETVGELSQNDYYSLMVNLNGDHQQGMFDLMFVPPASGVFRHFGLPVGTVDTDMLHNTFSRQPTLQHAHSPDAVLAALGLKRSEIKDIDGGGTDFFLGEDSGTTHGLKMQVHNGAVIWAGLFAEYPSRAAETETMRMLIDRGYGRDPSHQPRFLEEYGATPHIQTEAMGMANMSEDERHFGVSYIAQDPGYPLMIRTGMPVVAFKDLGVLSEYKQRYIGFAEEHFGLRNPHEPTRPYEAGQVLRHLLSHIFHATH